MKRIALLSLITLALCACQSNQRNSSPTLLKDGIQLRQKTVAVDADHAKVIMKANGGTNPVEFSIRREGDPDQRMETLGTVMDTGEGKVFNWIAKLTKRSRVRGSNVSRNWKPWLILARSSPFPARQAARATGFTTTAGQ